jgi:3'-5' exoribonuclease
MGIATPTPRALDIRELEDGDVVDQVMLVRDREVRQTRSGDDYLRLALADRTGQLAGVLWDDVAAAFAVARSGAAVHVTGVFSRHPRYGPQVTVSALEAPPEVDWDRLLAGPAKPIHELEDDLDALLAGVRDSHLAALVMSLLGRRSSIGAEFRHAFAAQYNHHAYRAGLLEHSLQVAHAVDAAVAFFPGIDRDLAVCGALLHDIGKLDAYSPSGHSAALNDAGKLVGEIPSGYYLVRRRIEEIPGFPGDLAQTLLHIILSHHGCLEHGSPVLPATREALLVHAMDKLSGDLGSVERLERETAEDDAWSRNDRALGRSVLVRSALVPAAGAAVGGSIR